MFKQAFFLAQLVTYLLSSKQKGSYKSPHRNSSGHVLIFLEARVKMAASAPSWLRCPAGASRGVSHQPHKPASPCWKHRVNVEERRGRTRCHCMTSSRGEWPTAVAASAEPDSQRPSQCHRQWLQGFTVFVTGLIVQMKCRPPNPPVAIWVLISAHHLYSVRFWVLRPVCKGPKTALSHLEGFCFNQGVSL